MKQPHNIVRLYAAMKWFSIAIAVLLTISIAFSFGIWNTEALAIGNAIMSMMVTGAVFFLLLSMFFHRMGKIDDDDYEIVGGQIEPNEEY